MESTNSLKRFEYELFFTQFSETHVLNYLKTYDDYFILKYEKDNSVYVQLSSDDILSLPTNISGFTYRLYDHLKEDYIEIEDFEIMYAIDILKQFSKN